MRPRRLSLRQVIAPERRRWMPFRHALSNEDQEACDQMFAEAAQQLQADIQLGRPWRFETLIMAVVLGHEKRLEQVRMRQEAMRRENEWPAENPPEAC
jgi:hypothetical protein